MAEAEGTGQNSAEHGFSGGPGQVPGPLRALVTPTE